MTRSLAIAVLCCTVFTFPSAVETASAFRSALPSALPSAAGRKSRSKKASRTTIRAEGATLGFQKLALPADLSDESAVLKKLRELKGTLKLQKDVTYRRKVLPAGSYPLTIVQDASNKYYFVIGNPPKEDAKKKPKAKKKESPDTIRTGIAGGMGIAGDYLRRLAEDEDDSEEKAPAKKKSKSTRKKNSSRKSQKSPSGGKGGKAQGGAKKKGEPVEKKDREAAELGPWLRARMHFVDLEKGTTEARFDLKTVESGRKLELSACAGTNCGRARLTFVPKKGKD